MRHVLIFAILLLAGCSPNVDGEYISTKKALFFSIPVNMTIAGDSAVITVEMPGTGKTAKDTYLVKQVSDQIALYKAEKPDEQIIFNVEDDGKKLVFQKTGKADLPEVWTKKVKI